MKKEASRCVGTPQPSAVDLDPDREVVGADRVGIDLCRCKAAHEAAADKDVIEMHAFAMILGIHPAIAAGRVSLQRRKRVDRRANARNAAVIAVLGAGKNGVFRRLRRHVEVTHDDVILGQWRVIDLEFNRARDGAALGDERVDALVQMDELPAALVDGDVIEMHRVDTHCPRWRFDNGLRCAALEIDLGDRSAARQKQRSGREDRPAREYHVAELEARSAWRPAIGTLFDMQVASRSIHPEMVGKKRRKVGHHVGIVVPGEAASDLLERDDVGALEARSDSVEVVDAIKTEAVLYVIARKLHDNPLTSD